MAGLEEVNISDILPRNVANSSKIVDNEHSDEGLEFEEPIISMDDLNELALTDPSEYERIQSGGEISA